MIQTGAGKINRRQAARTFRPNGFRPLAGILLPMLFLLGGTVDANIRSERWRWSNPLPHGNNVLDMKVNGEFGLQVGDAGSLYTMGLDGRWSPADTGVNNYLRSTAFFGDRIVAVGEKGVIIWSDDGFEFQQARLAPVNTDDWFEGVTASGQRLVAVGDCGTIYTSTNGAEWVVSSSGTSEWLRGVAFGGGAFVAVGEKGTILRSSSSVISWSAVDSPTTEHLNRVRYFGTGVSGRFYAVGNNGTFLSSVTGMAPWTSMNSGTTNHLYDVALNDAGLLLVGDEALRMSIDGGANWTDQINGLPTNAPPAWTYLSAHGKGDAWLVAGRTGLLMEGSCTNGSECAWQSSPTNSSRAWIWDMTVQRGLYVAVGDLANIKTSLDGILWAREGVPVSQTNTVLLGVGGTSNLLLAVGNDGNVLVSEAGLTEITVTNDATVTNIMIQSLGVIWTNLAPFTTNSLQGIDADDGLFIMTGEAGSIFTSPDGTYWTARTPVTTSFLSSVAIGNGTCIAAGGSGTLIRSVDDGASWTPVSMGTTNWLYRARWIENRFVVVGQNGGIYTSPDGIIWTQRTSGTTRWLTDVTYIGDRWFVSGYQGTLLTSTNLEEWSALPVPTGKSLFSAASKNGQLVLAGIEGVILRNQAEPVLTPVSILGYDFSISTDTNGVETAYELILFGGEPDQFFEFQSTTNLNDGVWTNLNGVMEMYNPDGTLYAIRTRDATNTPPGEFYRTQLLP